MNTGRIKVPLVSLIEMNPKETITKGHLGKKIGMDKLQPFSRDVLEYEIAEFNGGSKFRNGDTIMARITPCLENGKTAMINILDENEVGFGSTEYIVFRAKEGFTTPDFVYYLIISSFVRNPAIKSMVGSSGRQRVQLDVLQALEVSVPPLDEQKKIASILKVLDDKIALNNAINCNLYLLVLLITILLWIHLSRRSLAWAKGCLSMKQDVHFRHYFLSIEPSELLQLAQTC